MDSKAAQKIKGYVIPVDMNGACLKIDGNSINCLGIGYSVTACNSACVNLAGTYYAKDSACASWTNTSEGATGSRAPAYIDEKENFWVSFFSWLFMFEWG
ncbi:hypothetical protein EXS74_03080 [Candidatus Woesearchaeota archaeon]|nr:hypothetical protein [Candidatus Woesearchaeota archaeon]